jgi:hypothetical protein
MLDATYAYGLRQGKSKGRDLIHKEKLNGNRVLKIFIN